MSSSFVKVNVNALIHTPPLLCYIQMIVIIFITNQYENIMLFISPFANQIELQIKANFNLKLYYVAHALLQLSLYHNHHQKMTSYQKQRSYL